MQDNSIDIILMQVKAGQFIEREKGKRETERENPEKNQKKLPVTKYVIF